MARTAGRARWIVAAVIAAAVVLALAAAPRLAPVAGLKAIVGDGLRQALGGAVELGDVDLRAGLRPVLRVRGAALAGTAATLAAAGAGGGVRSYDLQVERADLTLAWRPLLRGQVRLQGINLHGCRLDLEAADGAVSLAGAALRASGLQWTAAGAYVADLELTAAAADFGGWRCAELMAAGELSGAVLMLQDVRAACGAGELQGEIAVDMGGEPYSRVRFTLRGRAVPAPDLLQELAPEVARRLEGDFDLDLSGSCETAPGAAFWTTLTAEGVLRAATPGVVHAGDWLEDVRPYLGERQDLVEIDFTRADGRIVCRGGRCEVQELVVTGGRTDWSAAGQIEPVGSMDLRLKVRLPAGYTPELGGLAFLARALRDEQGRIVLPLRVQGPTERALLQVDMQALLGGQR